MEYSIVSRNKLHTGSFSEPVRKGWESKEIATYASEY